MKVRYIGTSNYQEYPVTGTNALWQPEWVSDVSDSRATALVALGTFVYEDDSTYAKQLLDHADEHAAMGVTTIGGIDTSGVVDATDIIQEAIDSAGSGTLLRFPDDAVIKVTAGFIINKRIGVYVPDSSRIHFVPSVANDVLFTWTVSGATAANMNEEYQLDGVTCHLRISSDRSVRANGVRFIKVDNVSLHLRTFGLKGFSCDFQKSREAHSAYIRTRFCGYLDSANAANNVADIILQSPSTVSGDRTNYCKFGHVFSIYPLGPAIYIQSAHQITFDSLMIHAIPQANVAQEAAFVVAFGGATGWTDGVANNEVAGLHVNPGGTVATISGRTLDAPFKGCIQLCVNGSGSQSIVKVNSGEIMGTQANLSVLAANLAEIYLGNLTITAATSAQYASVITSITTDTLLLATTGCPVTGTPVRFSNSGGALPTGLVDGTTYYTIWVDATHTKLASSYDNALAGTAISVSGGSGTNTMTSITGYLVTAVNSGKIFFDGGQTYLNDGYQAGYSDSSSLIVGECSTGSTFAQGPVIPRLGKETMVAYLKNANMASTADQQLTKTYGNHRYCVTRAIFRHRSGAYATACVGGIYTSASKVGSQLVTASQSYAALTAANTIVHATVDQTVLTAAAPYLSLTTANAAALTADVYLFGYPLD